MNGTVVARIEAPATQPARFGLFSAAQLVTDDTADTGPADRWQFDGADWHTPWCADADTWDPSCNPGPTPTVPVTVTVTATSTGPDESTVTVTGSVPAGTDPRVVRIQAPHMATARLSAQPGGGPQVRLGPVPLSTRTVHLDLDATPDTSIDPPQQALVTGQATITDGPAEPPRTVTVKIGPADPANVTTGAPAGQIAAVPIPHRTVTVTATAAADGTVTAAATVSGGPARTVLVTVGTLDPVSITTGQPAATLGTLGVGDHPVEIVDDTTNRSATGTLTIVDGSGGTLDVPLDVPYAIDYTVTLTDTATGTASTGTLTLAVDGTGTAALDHTWNDPVAITGTAVDLASGDRASATLVIGPDGTGTQQITIQARTGSTKQVEPGVDYGHTMPPVAVFAGVECWQMGLDDATGKARSRLVTAESRAFEHHYWTTWLAPRATDITPAGGPVDLDAALALLEHELGERYGGIGVLHAARGVAVYARGWIDRDGPRLRTRLDTRWAFGTGYPGTGPGGTDPADGATWLYATGAVVIRRGPILIPAGPSTGAFNTETNRTTVIAERLYTAGHDCTTLAVHTQLTTVGRGISFDQPTGDADTDTDAGTDHPPASDREATG